MNSNSMVGAPGVKNRDIMLLNSCGKKIHFARIIVTTAIESTRPAMEGSQRITAPLSIPNVTALLFIRTLMA